MMSGTARRRMKPRRRLPASTATIMKYGNELRDMRSVPSRSAATDSGGDDLVPLHSVIDGKLRLAVAIFLRVMTACEWMVNECCNCREKDDQERKTQSFKWWFCRVELLNYPWVFLTLINIFTCLMQLVVTITGEKDIY